ncbi:hypothetical protein FM042_06665 [Aliidiomarina halalkaliphila]|uniref:Uncharacterized protein n=1 Tax=Aliidiomarina halalkaliphila TaxID=2593535 RepID=A0A552X228_9GAMM|nr:hypothetical protein [Aliidiomarina halalkaliphila]TRW48663.1 hypothetical protein FM042_06665 [Aliidiomarina halalkaliphila]
MTNSKMIHALFIPLILALSAMLWLQHQKSEPASAGTVHNTVHNHIEREMAYDEALDVGEILDSDDELALMASQIADLEHQIATRRTEIQTLRSEHGADDAAEMSAVERSAHQIRQDLALRDNPGDRFDASGTASPQQTRRLEDFILAHEQLRTLEIDAIECTGASCKITLAENTELAGRQLMKLHRALIEDAGYQSGIDQPETHLIQRDKQQSILVFW